MDIYELFFFEYVKIVDFYCFEGEFDFSDSVVLYVIEIYMGEKGMFIDVYGVY